MALSVSARAALAAGILLTVLAGGFVLGALCALIEDTTIELDDDD